MPDKKLDVIIQKISALEFRVSQLPTRDDMYDAIKESEDRMLTHIDEFIGLHMKLEQEGNIFT